TRLALFLQVGEGADPVIHVSLLIVCNDQIFIVSFGLFADESAPTGICVTTVGADSSAKAPQAAPHSDWQIG
ncbi:hypothetical protein, partial [Pseudomonas sp.]|uniref:hypothetical protein n=1 Tax=Pseudomonas sp. TaxID=306 RepID=UPI002613741A